MTRFITSIGTQRAGHDARAQCREVVGGEVRQGELGDEHGRHPVEGGSAEVLHGFQRRGRRERPAGDDGGGPVAERRQVPDHHAEAVIEGHRDHHAVVFGVAQLLADRIAVVEDVVVRQRGALREPRGAGGVLQVDGVVRVQRRHARLQRGVPDVVSPLEQLGVGALRLSAGFAGGQPVQAGVREEDQLAQLRARRQRLPRHPGVVAVPVRRRGDQHAHAVLLDHELELVAAVGGVDVDQDRPDLRGGVLQDGPLGAVGAPDADPLALRDAQGEERTRQAVDVVVQLGVAPPPGLFAGHRGRLDQGIVVREPRRDPFEVRANGFLEQRDVSVPGCVSKHGVTLPTVRRQKKSKAWKSYEIFGSSSGACAAAR